MSTVETTASLLAKINQQYCSMLKDSDVGKINASLKLLGWTGTIDRELPELLRIFISVLRSSLKSEEYDLDDEQAFYDFVRDDRAYNNSYSGAFLELDENKNLKLTSCILNEELVSYSVTHFWATKENMLLFLEAIEEFTTERPKIMIVETMASMLVKINAQYKYMMGTFGQHTRLAASLHLLGWVGNPGKETEELFKVFVSVHKSLLNGEEPDPKDLELFRLCVNDDAYGYSFLAHKEDGGFELKMFVQVEDVVKFAAASFHTTKVNMLTFLAALQKFATDEDPPEVYEKYILAIQDEDGKLHPVGDCLHLGYSATLSPREKLHLNDYALFDSIEELNGVIAKHPAFVKPNIYNDGHHTPPTALWSGLGINDSRKSSQGRYLISKVTVEIVDDRPTGTYAITDHKAE